VRFWLLRETENARLYSTTDPKDIHRTGNEIWIPKSVIEHTTKRGDEHDVKLPDWFIEARGL
jgi:hypothetical protein